MLLDTVSTQIQRASVFISRNLPIRPVMEFPRPQRQLRPVNMKARFRGRHSAKMVRSIATVEMISVHVLKQSETGFLTIAAAKETTDGDEYVQHSPVRRTSADGCEYGKAKEGAQPNQSTAALVR